MKMVNYDEASGLTKVAKWKITKSLQTWQFASCLSNQMRHGFQFANC